MRELCRQRPSWQRLVQLLSLDQFLVSEFAHVWPAHLELDEEGEGAGHSQELYMVWAEKSAFLQRGAALNPFGTDFFFWVDIGLFRNASDMHRFAAWPSAAAGAPFGASVMVWVACVALPLCAASCCLVWFSLGSCAGGWG